MINKRSLSPKTANAIIPKPVHPTAARLHGLLGQPYVKQHMFADQRWTPTLLATQFKKMAELLAKRLVFQRMEDRANMKRDEEELKRLREECYDGRRKLRKMLHGENRQILRNFLINHKDMMRLYQRLPIRMAADNINQRTFVLRKERDRLHYKLDLRKAQYNKKLIERSRIENHLKYENEFTLDEEIKSMRYIKKIENSKLRLEAIKAINSTYRRMIQVLNHDCIFYDPILRSLQKDISDQGQFIKHVLFLGMPVLTKFKELSEEYRVKEDKMRRNLLETVQSMSSARRPNPRPARGSVHLSEERKAEFIDQKNRYARETKSMLSLMRHLEYLEEIINRVKDATVSAHAREIYQRMKLTADDNSDMRKVLAFDLLGYRAIEVRRKRAKVLASVLVNNLGDEEIARLQRIELLRARIAEEDKKQRDTMTYIKNRADIFVVLRVSLWNIGEILRHVDFQARPRRIGYPSSYLKLPLLKFDMLTMRTYAPDKYEENFERLMRTIKRKIIKLCTAFKGKYSKRRVKDYTEQYSQLYENIMTDDAVDDIENELAQDGQHADMYVAERESAVEEAKLQSTIPSRKQMKIKSIRMVDDLSRRDD